mmetsp:Transcript_1603/g.2479  ORF Transcript_1603/g.2479 Transcript_1603/m.2479 type:complete len:85 (+) Transcript_1603:331-585(+)
MSNQSANSVGSHLLILFTVLRPIELVYAADTAVPVSSQKPHMPVTTCISHAACMSASLFTKYCNASARRIQLTMCTAHVQYITV